LKIYFASNLLLYQYKRLQLQKAKKSILQKNRKFTKKGSFA